MTRRFVSSPMFCSSNWWPLLEAFLLQELRRQASWHRVAHVERGGFHESTHAVAVPGGQPIDEKHALQHGDMVMNRLARHRGTAPRGPEAAG
jgi:hypothetical protein